MHSVTQSLKLSSLRITACSVGWYTLDYLCRFTREEVHVQAFYLFTLNDKLVHTTYCNCGLHSRTVNCLPRWQQWTIKSSIMVL